MSVNTLTMTARSKRLKALASLAGMVVHEVVDAFADVNAGYSRRQLLANAAIAASRLVTVRQRARYAAGGGGGCFGGLGGPHPE